MSDKLKSLLLKWEKELGGHAEVDALSALVRSLKSDGVSFDPSSSSSASRSAQSTSVCAYEAVT